MRRMLTALTLLIAASAAAEAGTCKDEVAAALERQRKTSAFRMETKMLSPEGIVDMTVEYVLPDRMRQVVSSTADPDPVETVRVGHFAWSRRKGEPWTPLNPQLTGALISQMENSVGTPEGTLGEFECLGKKPFGDKQFLAYQGENEKPGEKKQTAAKPKLPDRPVRVIFVDPTTGLPMRSVFARANKLEKPIFEARYSYPADIMIEAPKPRKKGESQ
jgi:hypothetical protein